MRAGAPAVPAVGVEDPEFYTWPGVCEEMPGRAALIKKNRGSPTELTVLKKWSTAPGDEARNKKKGITLWVFFPA